MYIAVTTFAAWALKPPILPAMAEPIIFFEIFTSTNAWTLVFKAVVTISAGTIASQTTDLPRPSILKELFVKTVINYLKYQVCVIQYHR